MADPITAGTITTLALSKFAEGTVSETAKKLVESLWSAIANRFKGRKKVEEAIAQLEASKGQAPEAEENLATVLKSEMFQDDAFAEQLQQMAQQITQIQNQNQTQATNTFTSNDNSQMRAVGQVYGTANFGDQK